MIVVMGAAGSTGGATTRSLLEAGEHVRVLGRSRERLEPFAKDGAVILTGEATDATYLTSAFRGADAAFTLLPDDLEASDHHALHDRMGEAVCQAIRDSGVSHVVFISSLGAQLPEGIGLLAGLHAQEERLRALPGVNALVLRNGWFFENFYAELGPIKEYGVNSGPITPDLPIPMIAARDIGAVAAAALRDRDFDGFTVRELLGERDLTMAEATAIIGARIGRPDLPYVQTSYADYTNSLVQAGFSEHVAGLVTEMCRALNEGRLGSLQRRSAASTTPTRFETFADSLAEVY